MTTNINLIDKYYYEFWNEHFGSIGGPKYIRQFQFKFKLYPYNGIDYSGEAELVEKIKLDEAMFGASIFCKRLNCQDALALANKFAGFRKLIGDVEYYQIDEGILNRNEVYFFIAYVFTLEKDLAIINNKYN